MQMLLHDEILVSSSELPTLTTASSMPRELTSGVGNGE